MLLPAFLRYQVSRSYKQAKPHQGYNHLQCGEMWDEQIDYLAVAHIPYILSKSIPFRALIAISSPNEASMITSLAKSLSRLARLASSARSHSSEQQP
jgi:hypothetical protein